MKMFWHSPQSGLIILVACLALLLPTNGVTQSDDTIKIIYIVPFSHWDLGFLAPPEEILPRLKPHIDEVIANAKADPGFRWTIESTWQLGEWLKRTDDKKKVEELVELIQQGRIQVSAVFGSMHTEFMGAEALNRLVYDWKQMEKRLGIKSDLAMMNDVPGFTSRLPQVLRKSGIRYFVTGSNLFIGGGTSLYPEEQPFYWQGPDGSRVLMWQTQGPKAGYTEAISEYYLDPRAVEPYFGFRYYPEEWVGLSNVEIQRRGVKKLLKKYNQAGYPYDAVMVLYSHDFISSNFVTDYLLPSVREWNTTGREPRMVVATPAEFFEHLEQNYGQDFPVHPGDWTGLWAEVKVNSPGISALARWLHHHLPAAEQIWTLLKIREAQIQQQLSVDEYFEKWFKDVELYPQGNLQESYYKLFKYEEHSGGAQTGWPKLMTREEVDQQNREYVNYVKTSQSDLQHLIKDGLRFLGTEKYESRSADGFYLYVYNPLSWRRTDVVRFHVPEDSSASVRNGLSGEVIPTQPATVDSVEFIAQNIPSLGYRTYWVELRPREDHEVVSVQEDVTELENQFYRVRVRRTDGSIVSLRDKTLGKELVNQSASHAMNELMRWALSETRQVGLSIPSFTRESGPVAERLLITRSRCPWPTTEIVLYRGLKRVEIINGLNRERMMFAPHNRDADYYSYLFPFQFSQPPTLRIGNGIGFQQLPEDYLPGARTDGAVPLHTLVLTGDAEGEPLQVTLAHRDSFFFHLPTAPGASPGTLLENTVRATVIRRNEQGETKDWGVVNFSDLEPGLDFPDRYRFAIGSTGESFDPVSAYRLGWELNMPLLVAELPAAASPRELEKSHWSINQENVALLAFKPHADGQKGQYTVRLQEIAGRRTEVELRTRLPLVSAQVTSLTEEKVDRSLPTNPLRLTIGPHETLTIQVHLSYGKKEKK